MTDDEVYGIYVRNFGKVRTGHMLRDVDFGDAAYDGWVAYPEEGRLAVSLAAEDCATKSPMSNKKALLERVRALLTD